MPAFGAVIAMGVEARIAMADGVFMA